MKRLMVSIAFASVVIFLSVLLANSFNLFNLNNNWETVLDNYLTDKFSRQGPGIGISVLVGGKVYFQKTYGLANIEEKTPVRENTSFRMGSNTKAFTAMGILLLDKMGKLSVNDQVSQHIGEFKSSKFIEYSRKLKIIDLLSHHGGVPDVYENLGGEDTLFNDVRHPRNLDEVKILAWQKPLFSPGEKFQYSNAGYDVLAEIIKRVSGQSFGGFLKEHIFDRLGMRNSFVLEDENTHLDRAYGYDEDQGEFQLNDSHPLNRIVGAGGVYSSLQDLKIWLNHLKLSSHEKGSSENQDISMLNQIFSRKYLVTPNHWVGFGWFIDQEDAFTLIRHGGGWVGFRSYLAMVPEKDIDIIMLSNTSSFSLEERRSLVRDILKGFKLNWEEDK